MEQELQYAYLLEMPVESCRIVTRRAKRRTVAAEERTKARVIDKVNAEEPFKEPADRFAAPTLPPQDLPVAEEGAFVNSNAIAAKKGEISAQAGAFMAERAAVVENAPAENVKNEETAEAVASSIFADQNATASDQNALIDEATVTMDAPSAPAGEENNFAGQTGSAFSQADAFSTPKDAFSTSKDAFSTQEDAFSAACAVQDLPPLSEVMQELAPAASEAVPPRAAKKLRPKKGGVAFAVAVSACAVLAALFLANAFFFRFDAIAYITALAKQPDARTHADFAIALPVSESVQLKAEGGILSFMEKGSVYAPAEGKVLSVRQAEEGYTIEIAHSDCFKTVITGADIAFFSEGERVYRAQPIAYNTAGDLCVSFYENGALLSNCSLQGGAVTFS